MIMLKTLKSKITFLTLAVLFFLGVVISIFSYTSYTKEKKLLIESSDFEISSFAYQLEEQILILEAKAKDLALFAETYYKTGKNDNIASVMVKEFFNQSRFLSGGGIWFKPYVIDIEKQLTSFYAFKNKDNQVVLDRNYGYADKAWYLEIVSELAKKRTPKWSKPYYEKQDMENILTTVGVGIYDEEDNLLGISTIDWEINSIIKTLYSMKPTENSFALLADTAKDFVIVSTDNLMPNANMFGGSLKNIPWYNGNISNINRFTYHEDVYLSYSKKLSNGMLLIINIPEDELFYEIRAQRLIMMFFLILSVFFIIAIMYYALSKSINKPIYELMHFIQKLSHGNIEETIEIEQPLEFAKLAKTFNQMVNNLKKHIANIQDFTQKKEKAEAEMLIAQQIQSSFLPTPYYPNSRRFNIYAIMDPAREVGGDFYDFFHISKDKFAFLIADVSGKGIPAALFMMASKTMMQNILSENKPIEETIAKINTRILENNPYGFFVTALIGIMDLPSGKTTIINCGHNIPLIKRNIGKYEFIDLPSNIALGATTNFDYQIYETTFNAGDVIFLYTDGLAEALNKKRELFTQKRIVKALNKIDTTNPETILSKINKDVAEFSGGALQNDDLTMLALRYNGDVQKEEISILADKKSYLILPNWLKETCKILNLDEKNTNKIYMITEESFVNIVSYAYKTKKGMVKINIEKNKENIKLSFTNSGVKFNPLDIPEPDIDKNINEREIGGLGIYIAKKMSDNVLYQYKKGKNILTFIINL